MLGRWRRLAVLLFAWLVASACKTGPVAGACPEMTGLRCMTKKICEYSKTRGCQVCRCKPAWNSDRFNEDERVRSEVLE